MSKRNNKGFTLVELIIAMSILSIALTLGYKVMNSSEKVTKNQMEVFGEQQDANLVNLYLTKDLEQVRKFTTANTGSNPYTYILNDGVQGVEKIEYEVEKTTDGKFYTVTRKTSSGSIELISDYPTSSQIPFSISLVENTDNLFKVSLNGKSRKSEVSKYEFEVSSRVQNNVTLVETPITSGGIVEQPPQSSTPQQPEQKPPQSSTPNPETSVPKKIISGQILVGFKHQGRTNEVKVTATSNEITINETTNEKNENVKNHDEKVTLDKQEFYSYHVYAEIPIESNELKVSLTSTERQSVNIGNRNNVFGDSTKWNPFKSKLNNNKIYIYTDNFATIKNLKIDDSTKDISPDKTYYYKVEENKKIVKVEFDVQINSNFKNSTTYTTIGFGEFSI